MGKIKLTQAQADIVENIRANVGSSGMVRHKVEGGWKLSQNSFLNRLTLDGLVKALYIGYEVAETPLVVGDWAKAGSSNGKVFIGKILEIEDELKAWAYWNCEDFKGFIYLDELKKCSLDEVKAEEEVIWWNKHNREVWELKQGDILMGTGRELYEVTATPQSHRYNSYTGNGIYDFAVKECREKNWAVVCFVENRLD